MSKIEHAPMWALDEDEQAWVDEILREDFPELFED